MTLDDAARRGERAPDAPSKYRAFISYRHADKAWGDWLHKALESYRVPRELVGDAGPRLGRIFRDREELSAAHDLGAEIQEALKQSANLVVLCSPGAAQSKWVNEEILAYKRLGRGDRIFAIIVAGEPNAADPAAECFPPALKYELGPDGELSGRLAEPVAADARDHADGRDNAKLKLIAGLLGVDYDQLRRRQLEAERRALRRFIAIAVTLVLIFAGLAAAAGWFYLDAERQRVEAVRQRDRAEAAVDSARGVGERLTRNLVRKLRDTEGVQAKVLQDILEEVGRLMDELSSGGEVGDDERLTQAWTHCELVESKIETGDLAGALADAEACVVGLDAVAATSPQMDGLPPRRALAYGRRAEAKLRLSDLDGAESDFKQALAITEAVAAADPVDEASQMSLRILHVGLGRVHDARGDLAAARGEFEKALEIALRLVDEDPRSVKRLEGLALSFDYLGDVQAEEGDLPAARRTYEAGLSIRRRLAEARPGDTDILLGVAVSLTDLGDVQLRQGDHQAALASYGESLAICERLTAADPTNVGYRDALSVAHVKLGDTQAKLRDLDAAGASYDAALAIREPLCAADPSNLNCQRSLSSIHTKIANVRFAAGDRAGARDHLMQALAIAEAVVKASPGSLVHQRDLSQCHWRLGLLSQIEQDFDAALEQVRAARDIIAPLAMQYPANAVLRKDMAIFDAKLAELETARAAASPP